MPRLLTILSILAVAMYTAVMGYSLGVISETDSSVAASVLRGVTRSANATTAYAPRNWKVWRDGTYGASSSEYAGYSLSFPRDFDVIVGEGAAADGFIGRPSVRLSFPEDSFLTPRTNFASADITVRYADDPRTVARCFDNPNPIEGEPTLTNVVNVNGISFRRGFVTEAAAGNLYDTRVYRTLQGGRCYEISLTVHTGNIGNYTPGSVAEFDKERAFRILEKILATFAVTDKAPQ